MHVVLSKAPDTRVKTHLETYNSLRLSHFSFLTFGKSEYIKMTVFALYHNLRTALSSKSEFL